MADSTQQADEKANEQPQSPGEDRQAKEAKVAEAQVEEGGPDE